VGWKRAPGGIVVRTVEVEPAAAPIGEMAPKQSIEGLALLVPKTISRFTVVVEFVEIAVSVNSKEKA